jgi:membrane protein DedA with SNARE-associated domain/membrane-associated phospholipid phosphatase
MHGTLAGLVGSYGYVFLLVIVGLESFGIPLPGETALVTAAAFAAAGRLNIVGVVAAASIGAIVGDNAGYWLGSKGGIALVRRYGSRVGLNDAKLARAHAFFGRYGARTVFIGRFIALLRSWAAVLAGVSGMPYGTFMFYNAAGGLAWAILFGTLGYVFGRNLPMLERYAGQVSLAAALLIALSAGVLLFAGWFRTNRTILAERVSQRWERGSMSPKFAAFRTRHARLWTLIAARFEPAEYLALHLTVGIALSLAALWLFAGVTEDVINHDPLTGFDLMLVGWFRAHATPVSDRIALAVSLVGSPVALAIVATAVAIVLIVQRRWIVLAGWCALFVGGELLDWSLELAIRRPLPSGTTVFLAGPSFGFPVGYAIGSLLGYGMLAYLLVTLAARRRRTRAIIVAAATILCFAIGLSRLVLGVHYFSDAIGGYAAGVVWLAACVSGVEVAVRQRGRSP